MRWPKLPHNLGLILLNTHYGQVIEPVAPDSRLGQVFLQAEEPLSALSKEGQQPAATK